MIQGHYEKVSKFIQTWTVSGIRGLHNLPSIIQAFTTLVRLRKERVLAVKELCSIYYQIQVFNP